LEKLPADRFQSATIFAEALANRSFTLPTALAGASSLTAKGESQSRRLVLAGAIVIAAVAGYLVGILADGKPAQPRQVVRFAVPTGQVVVSPRGSSIAMSADGSRIAYVRKDSMGGQHILVHSLDASSPVPIPATEGGSQPFFSPDGQSLGFWQDGKLKRVPLGGGEVSIICDAPKPYGVSWGPNGIIVFSTGSLHRVPAAGGEPVRLPVGGIQPHILQDGRTVLVSTPSVDEGPSLAILSLEDDSVTPLNQPGLAPHGVDGGYVVFVSPDGVLLTSKLDSRRKRLIGTPRQIQDGVFDGMYWGGGTGWAHLGVSRSGAFVYLDGQSRLSELVTVDREGGETSVDWAEPRRYGFPRFSPDGRHLTVEVAHPTSSNAADIWTLDLGLRTPNRLTFDSSSAYPELTPDGSHVVYSKFIAPGDWDLFRVGIDGGSPQHLLELPREQWIGVVSPDSLALIFMEFDQGNHLWTVPSDRSVEPKRLTASRFFERAPAVSPNGRWLAYTSGESRASQNDVYVLDLSDPEVVRPVSVGGGREPVWRPDGRELFFRSANGDTLFSVSVTPGDQFVRGAVRRIWVREGFATNDFQANYDVHPDGQQFIFVRDLTRDVRQVHVVLNWFDQLAVEQRN
jgi:Tol biopolymer transport system component